MVSTQNGTRLTDMDLRNGVERIMARHQWTTNRVAADLHCSELKLIDWLENPHATAFTTFRSALVEFVKTWDRPEDTAPTDRQMAAFNAAPRRNPWHDDFPDTNDTAVPPSSTLWQLPAGFVPIAPLPRSNTLKPAGITVAKNHQRATLSRALVDGLGKPESVLIAMQGSRLIVTTAREGYPSMRLNKDGDVSKSVAAAVKAEGAAPGFYPATPAGDGVWTIDLG